MNDKHMHTRDHEDVPVEHRRSREDWMPESIRWVPNFINRVGFPIFAFCILAYFHFQQNERMIKVIGDLKDVMITVKTTIETRRGGHGG